MFKFNKLNKSEVQFWLNSFFLRFSNFALRLYTNFYHCAGLDLFVTVNAQNTYMVVRGNIVIDWFVDCSDFVSVGWLTIPVGTGLGYWVLYGV